jgi:peptidoglycan/LPS O-acetylase OafA/YrhL
MDFEKAKGIFEINSSFVRASSYFIGIIFGFLIYKWENKPGERKTFSIYYDLFANFNLFSTIISMVFIQKSADFLKPSQDMQYLIFSIFRINWAIIIGLFCVSNHFATEKNLMKKLLSLEIWRPFVRISYSVYLIHPLYQFTIVGASPRLDAFGYLDLFYLVINSIDIEFYCFFSILI